MSFRSKKHRYDLMSVDVVNKWAIRERYVWMSSRNNRLNSNKGRKTKMQPRPGILFMVAFHLRSGQTVQVAMGEATARKAVADWLAGFAGKQKIGNLDYPPGDQPWAVDTAEIVSVQTFNLSAQPKAAQQQAAYQSPFGIPQSGM